MEALTAGEWVAMVIVMVICFAGSMLEYRSMAGDKVKKGAKHGSN